MIHAPHRNSAMPSTTPGSIRRFLITSILLIVTAGLSISALFGYLDAVHESEELFDARLAQSARVLNPLLNAYRSQIGTLPAGGKIYDPWDATRPAAAQHENDDEEAQEQGHTYERKLYFQLLDARGTLLLRSPSAPEHPQIPLAAGFSHVQHDQHRWRSFTLHNPDRQTWLIVADRDDVREEMAGKIASRTMLPLLIVLPVLLILLWWLIARGTKPLTQLIQAISERHPANLSPLVLKKPVKELLPLSNEINRLMKALAETLEHEKQFTNEAAHELRTPLAVLRIHGENALASQDPESREQSLKKMLRALDRGDRLIRQLLTQARIDSQQAIELETLDLNALLRECIASLVPLALKKHQELAFEAEQQVWVQGQAILLELLFSNLIDNAIRYTPEYGNILVTLSREGNRVSVHVCDNGPGVDPALLPRLQERFFRIHPQQGDGAGLGLSIVQKVAQLHGASLAIQNREPSGLDVSLCLRASPSEIGSAMPPDPNAGKASASA